MFQRNKSKSVFVQKYIEIVTLQGHCTTTLQGTIIGAIQVGLTGWDTLCANHGFPSEVSFHYS